LYVLEPSTYKVYKYSLELNRYYFAKDMGDVADGKVFTREDIHNRAKRFRGEIEKIT
jgi:hypothetical protein